MNFGRLNQLRIELGYLAMVSYFPAWPRRFRKMKNPGAAPTELPQKHEEASISPDGFFLFICLLNGVF